MITNNTSPVVCILLLSLLTALGCHRPNSSNLQGAKQKRDEYVAVLNDVVFSLDPESGQCRKFDFGSDKHVVTQRIQFPEDELPQSIMAWSPDTILISYFYVSELYYFSEHEIRPLATIDHLQTFPGYVILCNEYRKRPLRYQNALIFALADTLHPESPEPLDVGFGRVDLLQLRSSPLNYRHPKIGGGRLVGDYGFSFSDSKLLISYSNIDSLFAFDLQSGKTRVFPLNLLRSNTVIPAILLSDSFFNNLCEEDVLLKRLAFLPSLYLASDNFDRDGYSIIYKAIEPYADLKRYPMPTDIHWKVAHYDSELRYKGNQSFDEWRMIQTVRIGDKEYSMEKFGNYDQIKLR